MCRLKVLSINPEYNDRLFAVLWWGEFVRVFRRIPEAAHNRDMRIALTIGNFDGVHRGHAAMVERVCEVARQRGFVSAVLSFDPHPLAYLKPSFVPPTITSLRDKLAEFSRLGLQSAYVCRFDQRWANMSAHYFIEKVLIQALGVGWLLVGEDFRFGRNRLGDVSTLFSYRSKHSFDLEVMEPVLADAVPPHMCLSTLPKHSARISSSSIREALMAGQLACAELLLGRPVTVSGRVMHGLRLGRTMGFPTINLRMPVRPALQGIFVVLVDGVGAQPWAGVACVGQRPTLNAGVHFTLEVHLFDFCGDLYGRQVCVRFVHKLRDECRFDSISQLQEAIAEDCFVARRYFVEHPL